MHNAAVSGVVGGTISEVSGGSFDQGALNASMGRLFNDMTHPGVLGTLPASVAIGETFSSLGGYVATGLRLFAGAASDLTPVGLLGLVLWSSDIGPEVGNDYSQHSPDVHPEDISGKTPSEIDSIAKGKGLIPMGSNPMSGQESYVDPATGKQRVLVHPTGGTSPHCHVNDCNGQRLDITGHPVKPESPEAHLPLGGF